MKGIAQWVGNSLKALDEGCRVPDAQMPKEQKVLFVVAFACKVFELFLRVHPYANGNGHAARFLTWSILGRYGYWPRQWPIHPRPNEPTYVEMISRYRSGDIYPLEQYFLNNILGK
jgi:hypothetical protein